MTPREKIGRLEELLGRVQRRAAEPRPTPLAAQGVSQPSSQVSPKATTGAMAATPMAGNGGLPLKPTQTSMAAQPEPAPAPPPQAQTPASPPVSEPPGNTFPTSPPASMPSEPPAAAGPSTIPPITTVAGGDDSDGDVEVSSEVVDIDVDVDMDDMGTPLESGAQPVADHSVFADDQGIGETTMADAQVPILGPENEVHSEAQPGGTPANEIEEPAPSSSPRPIASEKPEAFEEESAPRHTPPPESGKQVAAAPSTPPSRKTSSPPPSLEGHTLIGGWREPGLGGGPVIGSPGAPQGVRVPAPGAAAPPPAAKAEIPPAAATPASRPSSPPARHSDRPLAPEITRAELGAIPGAKVASFEGTPPAFKPSTFGELLDASLGL